MRHARDTANGEASRPREIDGIDDVRRGKGTYHEAPGLMFEEQPFLGQ